MPMPSPSMPADLQDVAQDGHNPFDRDLGWLVQHRDLILGIVFRRFGVAVPPESNDAGRHPELAGLKRKLVAEMIARNVSNADPEANDATGSKASPKGAQNQTEFWTEEAIRYLGLDRTGDKRPDMVLQRLKENGDLNPKKIGRRNLYSKGELDKVLAKGAGAKKRRSR